MAEGYTLELIEPKQRTPEDVIVAAVIGENSAYAGRLIIRRETEEDEEAARVLTVPRDCSLIPWPESAEDMTDRILVTGSSGSGKSHWAGRFCEAFLCAHPGGRILLVTAQKDKDPAFAAVESRLLRVPLESCAELDVTGLADTLLVADDFEGSEYEENVLKCLRRCLELGRRHGVSTLSLWHRGASGRATKQALAEATGVCWFPASAGSNTAYLLRVHFGLSEDLRAMLKGPEFGRWIYYKRQGPIPLIISEHRAALVDLDQDAAVARGVARKRRADLARAVEEAGDAADESEDDASEGDGAEGGAAPAPVSALAGLRL